MDEAWQGRRWVVETDIANCFSAIPHDKLMQAVEERISDRTVLTLLRAMSRAGVFKDGQVRERSPELRKGGRFRRFCATCICTDWTECGIPECTGCWRATAMTWWSCAAPDNRLRMRWRD
ncbi:hypothetical protein A4G28_13410 [Mycobacterium ostraviense]|uniref:Reverse transcriptase domain-containing protein n=1 Tax=Mycobacterium ostraviense TaxID=2738409 RepID=A0A164EVA3_9MYCO|nr:hypothetical protein A4G28_13410 [Mycobacterium ostraviense]